MSADRYRRPCSGWRLQEATNDVVEPFPTRVSRPCKYPNRDHPACHPIGALTTEHATVHPDRVTASWAASPDAAVVTPVRHTQFPAHSPEPATALYAPLSRGGLLRHGPESLILLPPSRRIDGHVTSWLRPFDERTVMLPNGEELFGALAQLTGDRDLRAWYQVQAPHPDGQLLGTRP